MDVKAQADCGPQEIRHMCHVIQYLCVEATTNRCTMKVNTVKVSTLNVQASRPGKKQIDPRVPLVGSLLISRGLSSS